MKKIKDSMLDNSIFYKNIKKRRAIKEFSDLPVNVQKRIKEKIKLIPGTKYLIGSYINGSWCDESVDDAEFLLLRRLFKQKEVSDIDIMIEGFYGRKNFKGIDIHPFDRKVKKVKIC